MTRIDWPLRRGRPCVEIVLTMSLSGQTMTRSLIADTGAGSLRSGFDLILDEDDCLLCGGNPRPPVKLGGAYIGSFPIYLLPVQLPTIGFAGNLRVVGVQSVPSGFDGIACFCFLNRFHYGNMGDPGLFGLEF